MLVNQRVRDIRRYRRLEGRELAKAAGVSPAAISLLESQRKLRTPRVDTLQKIARALDVTVGFLLGEEDVDVPQSRALSRQSLKVFLQHNEVTPEQGAYLSRVCAGDSAPDSVKGWKDLLTNVSKWAAHEVSLGTQVG
jgi:transcriptional regulator with XRE-family HTH domain